HLGPEPTSPPAPALPRTRRRHRAGRQQMDHLPPRLLPAGPGRVPAVPRPLPAPAGEGVHRRPAAVLLQLAGAPATVRVPAPPGAGAQGGVGDLREEAF